MKKREEVWVYIVVMAIALLVMIESINMHYFSSKILPLILSSMIFIFGGMGLTRALLVKDESGATAQDKKEKENRETWYRYSLFGAWVVGFFIAVYLVGFMVAIPLFTLTYLKTHGTRWRTVIIFTILTPAIVYGVFTLSLKLYLYEGLLFS